MDIFMEKSVYYTQVNMVQLNPAILNSNPFPLDLPCFSQSFTIGYLELSYLKQRAASLVPVLQTNLPHYLNSQLYEQIVASLES